MLHFYQPAFSSQAMHPTDEDMFDMYLHQARLVEQERHRQMSHALALQQYRHLQMKKKQQEIIERKAQQILLQRELERQQRLAIEKEIQKRVQAEQRLIAQAVMQARVQDAIQTEIQRQLQLENQQDKASCNTSPCQLLNPEVANKDRQTMCDSNSVDPWLMFFSPKEQSNAKESSQTAVPQQTKEETSINKTEPSSSRCAAPECQKQKETESSSSEYDELVNRVKLAFQMAADARRVAPEKQNTNQHSSTSPNTTPAIVEKTAPTEVKQQVETVVEQEKPVEKSTPVEESQNISPEHQSMYDRSKSLQELESIRSQFRRASETFVQPPNLEVLQNGEIAFSSTNMPVHRQENTLVDLMQKVDAVDSHGDELIRAARKNLVADIDRELQRIDAVKSEAISTSSCGSSMAGDDVADQINIEDTQQPHSEESPSKAEADGTEEHESKSQDDQESTKITLESDPITVESLKQLNTEDEYEMVNPRQ